MPGAINGEGDDLGYVFSTQAEATLIQQYYEVELGKQGYEELAVGQGQGKDTVFLIFTKGQEVISISIIPDGELNLVVITK